MQENITGALKNSNYVTFVCRGQKGRAFLPVSIESGSGWPAAGSTGTWTGCGDNPLWSRGSVSTTAPAKGTQSQ